MASFNFKVAQKGVTPEQYYKQKIKDLVSVLNEEALLLESQLVQDTPSGVSGRLRQGWTMKPATENKPTAIVGQSSQYFLPVEMGRKPGKGISEKGQKSVTRWAKLVMGLNPKEAKSFAFNLSMKYKNQGRPAVGFVGLATPGTIPTNSQVPDNPIPGSLLEESFQRLKNRLNSV